MKEVLKSDGRVESYNPAKLEASLLRANAGAYAAEHIRKTIERTTASKTPTNEVYKKAFAMLRRISRPAAARYSLRRAMFELGPAGFAFEDFVAELFDAQGWNVQKRQIVAGKCVMHEIDLYATRGNEHLAAELKYHNDLHARTDIKIALYVKARFEDIWQCDPAKQTCPIDRGFLITNTKFTSQAIQYAECAGGMELIGWNYPKDGNLYDRIVETGIYPLTVLTSLKNAEKKLLIEKHVVTCIDIERNRSVLRSISIPPERVGLIVAEIQSLRQM